MSGVLTFHCDWCKEAIETFIVYDGMVMPRCGAIQTMFPGHMCDACKTKIFADPLVEAGMMRAESIARNIIADFSSKKVLVELSK